MKKEYNIVTNYKIITEIKRSKYFKTNLGMSVTMDKNGERLISDKDLFAASYGYQYKTSIYAQGTIGNIKFYIDHYIKEDKIAAYLNLEEFVFDFDPKYIMEKGIDSYLGYILKSVDQQYEERTNKIKKEAEEKEKKMANPELVITNPGAVTYDDIKAYLQKKRLG